MVKKNQIGKRFPRRVSKLGVYITITADQYSKLERAARHYNVKPSSIAREFFMDGLEASKFAGDRNDGVDELF